METIKIKRKEFVVESILSNNSYKCSFKDKLYFVKHYDMLKTREADTFNCCKQLSKSCVVTPKVYIFDKKQGYIVSEFIDGQLMSDYILKHDFSDDIYSQIFRNSFMARVIRKTLNYDLDKWMIFNGTLYYVSDYCEPYSQESDFTKTSLRNWFLSKELMQYYEKNGVLFDKTRIKDEYTINKESVLMTCKYYQ